MHQLSFFLKNKIILIFIISLILFITKWALFVFSESNLEAKILFNYIADSKYWVPYIKFISEFSFNNSFDPDISNLNNLPMPIGSLFIYSFFYKLFGLYSLILIELIAIFSFLIIFYKIFNRFSNEDISLFSSLLIISLPGIIGSFDLDIWIIKNTLNNIYSLRLHRPVFSNIFFFICIYLLIKEIQEEKINNKNIYILSFVMGLLFSSFYYFFIIIFLSTLSILIYKIELKKNIIQNYYKLIIKSSIIFFITSLPFILNLYYHEKDISEGAGLIIFDLEKKIQIFKYFIFNYTKFEFLFIFFILSLITIFFKKNYNKKIILLFYIIFISSILSPIFFISLSPNSGLIYHFNNNILICIFLYFFILLVLLMNKLLINNSKLIYIFLFIFITFNVYNNLSLSVKNQKLLNTSVEINEFNQITDNLKKDFNNSFNTKGILTFDTNFMIWAILNDFKFINIINHMWTPKKHEMIENDLARNFYFLGLKKEDFEKFTSNKFMGWRYINENIGEIFGYRYQANSLVTPKNTVFDNPYMDSFILNSKPNLNQQIALSKDEQKRLSNLVLKNEKNPRIPEFIIINLKKEFLINYKIDFELYCNYFKGETYSLYYLKELSECK